jgi:hypothetical protein
MKANHSEAMRRSFAALLGLLIGYPRVCARRVFGDRFVCTQHFDGSVEASTTAGFVFGPAGWLVGLIAGAMLGKPKLASDELPPERKGCFREFERSFRSYAKLG